MHFIFFAFGFGFFFAAIFVCCRDGIYRFLFCINGSEKKLFYIHAPQENTKATTMTVKIYTTEWCHFCKEAKKFFKENNVKYTEVDVGKDQKAAEEMIEKSGQMGVPVIEIDKEIIVGFDRGRIKKALKI